MNKPERAQSLVKKRINPEQGMTLVEVLAAGAISAIILAAVISFIYFAFASVQQSNTEYQAHSASQMLIEKIQREVTYADSMAIVSSMPTSPAEGKYYLYYNSVPAPGGQSSLVKMTGSALTYEFIKGYMKNFYCEVAFTRTNGRSLNVGITIRRSASSADYIYRTQTDIYINNLGSNSIDGTSGSCIVYTVPAA